MRRRAYLRASALGLVGLAGCSGGGDGDVGGNSGGGDGGGGDATPEPISCTEFGSASLVPYDVAGTAFPCTFEYPEPIKEQNTLGDPIFAVNFQGPVGQREVLVTIQIADQSEGYTEDRVKSTDREVESFDYGDRTGYIITVFVPSGPSKKSQFTVMVPFERNGEVLYYGVLFSGQYLTGEENPPEKCLTAVDDVVREMLTTVAPNPETEFESTLGGG